LKQRADLERQMEASKRSKADIEDIKKPCELVERNLRNLSFEEKRMALETLQIKAFIDNNRVEIRGAISMECSNLQLYPQEEVVS